MSRWPGRCRWIAAFLAWLAVAVVLGVGQALIGGSYATGAIAAVVAALGVLLLVWRCERRLGGVTGDVMGAVDRGRADDHAGRGRGMSAVCRS